MFRMGKIKLSEEEKGVVKEVMDELGLSGGRVKMLVESVGVRVGFNKRKMRVAVKRALIGGEPTVKKR
ncbi:MAG: hypothetical protein ACTSWP_09510 [Candidatus Freyarchaeota archaeon]|nr:hypothetical protein [Candidatus Freyrarchaeum guaymaensis]